MVVTLGTYRVNKETTTLMVITHCVIPTSFGNLTSTPSTSFFKKGNNDYNKIYCIHLEQNATGKRGDINRF